MDEQRKYALLLAATILAARKLNEIGSRPSPARERANTDAIEKAERFWRESRAGGTRKASSRSQLQPNQQPTVWYSHRNYGGTQNLVMSG